MPATPKHPSKAFLAAAALVMTPAFVLLAGLSGRAQATLYSFTTIDVPGAIWTQVFGINDSGQIVGGYVASAVNGQGFHGFLDTGGSFTTIDVPGATNTYAYGINGSGQMVGGYTDSVGIPHGFLDTGGSFATIDVPGATATYAAGVNSSGQIVGYYTDSVGIPHGFLDSAGSFTTVDVPGAATTNAAGINGSGQIVGQYRDASGYHGFLDTAGSFATIDLSGTTFSYASGINGSGQILGGYTDSVGVDHSVLDTAGIFTTIDVPGAILTSADGINNSGKIVGSYLGPGSYALPHGFAATPIAGGIGDPHLTTFAGHDYDFQAAGEFLLTRSSVAGDSFEVQARTRAWADDSTIISGVAAKLGGRVTFDLDRARPGESFVWVDGHPTSLSVDNPILPLDGGRVVELSADEFQVIWDTGEILDVTDAGAYLNVTFPRSAPGGPGSVEGLLGSNTGWNNDFRLADGSLLDPQISTTDLYGVFADSWRVTDATSLFDSSATVPEPTTLSLLSVGIGLTGIAVLLRRATSSKPS
jgi:uncharacterized membrane protein